MDDATRALRALPSVDALLRTGAGERLRRELSPSFVTTCARALLADWREQVQQGRLLADALPATADEAASALEARVRDSLRRTLVPVVNATGVVVHTNLGRAPWPRAAAARALEAATRYSNLEYDLATGERGAREDHLTVASRLFGCEAALAVNNNAAAVLLALNSLAEGREAVVSRGELVEIGGSFRIPDVIAKSGARLREVGTTNRTRLPDYAAAIGPATALLLKVHPSNFRVVGFTESVPIEDLARLGKERHIPVLEDLGSGNVTAWDVATAPATGAPAARAGEPGEPTVRASIEAGADLVLVSGDKLLGGPQAGLLLGRRELVLRCKANPLYRALRPDKVTLAALEEVLFTHEAGDPWAGIPVLAFLGRDRAGIEARTRDLGARLAAKGYTTAVVAGTSTVGGGALPLSAIAGPVLVVRHPRLSDASLEEELRRRPRDGRGTPVIARVAADGVRLDLRTVFEDEDAVIESALLALL